MKKWMVTGAAGFIGSHLVDLLLSRGDCVVGIDNLSTGKRDNLSESPGFEFVEGDIRDAALCRKWAKGLNGIFHQAAMASVPASIEDPEACHENNITGFLNVLEAARKEGVKRVIYASSSAVYGDDLADLKVEDQLGAVLSPYALSKKVNELYASSYSELYGLETVGIRYFNIYGPRQDPSGAYAAVIPIWIDCLLNGKDSYINGDGKTTRDFCYVGDCARLNLHCALLERESLNEVVNLGWGRGTSLNELYKLLREGVQRIRPDSKTNEPIYRDFRKGDIRFSAADVRRLKERIGFEPSVTMADGISKTVDWFSRS